MVDIFGLPVVQRSDTGRLQKVGKADDVGQRRTQLVGNVLDEIVLQLVGLSQRLVLFLQRLFRLHAGRLVDEGQHCLCVRQRRHRIVEDQAGIELERAVECRSLVIESGKRLGKPAPAIRLGIGGSACSLDRLDMGAGFRLFGGNAPEGTESRV
ncbi:hypothetical protein D3C73_743130 [compost metagenome]